MRAVMRGNMLVGLVLACVVGFAMTATGQAPTTTIQDTVYRADGTAAGGTVAISWGSFTTTGGTVVPAGSTTVTLGTGGALSVALVPNSNSTPMGNYYTAVFHLNDGTTSREYWVVPYAVAGAGPAKLAAISNTVLPTTVAMQTVSKGYVDNAIAAAITGTPADDSPYVLKVGDTMTGPLVLPADPVSANQAADKNYVDENVAAIAAGLGGKVALLPAGTQVVSQPSGTQLEVNDLNGELYATQYLSGSGNNGIQSAMSSSSCTSGCTVDVEPTYPGTELPNLASMPVEGNVIDHRGGTLSVTAANPLQPSSTEVAAASVDQEVTLSTPALRALKPGGIGMDSHDLVLTEVAAAGGSNQFPEGIETAPYFKSTYGVLQMTGTYNTQGQHVQAGNAVYCYAVGDCLAGGQFIVSSGGYRDAADEGAHPFDLQITEDPNVFTGVCQTGCTTGSTQVTLQSIANEGTQGDGRYLIDTNPAKEISAGKIVGGSKTILGTVSFSGTSFGVSSFLMTAQVAASQTNNIAPGTVTLSIATSGVPSGFATNTAAVPASGVACVADVTHGALEVPNFEMANYSVVDGTHVQITLAKVHDTGAVLGIGGLCGYGLEQTVDTVSGIRQLFPVVGSTSTTSLYYADGVTPVVGNSVAQTPYMTSGYVNYAGTLTSLVRSGNVVTATTAANLPADFNGLTMTIAGVTDSSYNGSYAVTTTGPNTFTYANTGANSTSTGGTASYLNGSFVLYPMAEVVSVLDPASKTINGALTLGPNTVAWATGDAVEEPHYYQGLVYPDTELVTQYVPKPIQYSSAGKFYNGTVGPGTRGWTITNAAPTTQYLGGGGTHQPPDDAYNATGVWNNDLEATAGLNAVLKVHCNLHGCNRWDSTYALMDLDSQAGRDFLFYEPQADAFAWNLLGTSYTMSPSAFTAPVINVTTLNATTLNGSLSAGSITSGTIAAARLPVFGPSGASHAIGAVPDPGPTAGSTRYLREDGTWTAPSGGSMTWPIAAGVAVYAGSNSWGTSLTAPASALVGVTDTQTLTNKTVDGVSPTVFGYVDATSSIQTQLNAKAASGASTTVNGQTCALSGSCTVAAAAGTLTGSALASGITTASGLTAVAGGTFGSAAFTAASAYDAAGAASSALTTAEAYAANASNLSSGTVGMSRLPVASYRTATGATDTPTTADIQAICGVVVYTSSTGAAVTLPTTGLTTGTCVRLKNLTGTNQTVVVSPSSGTIEGNASVTLNYYADGVFLWSGSAWTVYGGIGVRGSSNLTTANSFVYVSSAGTVSQYNGTNCVPFLASTSSSPVCATAANVNTVLGTVSDTTITVGTSSVAANSCSSGTTSTMTGLATTMAFAISPASDVSGVIGWGPSSAGQLYLDAWPTANTLNYKVCNPTSASITPSASVTFNVAAR